MGKTLVIAEKPMAGADMARILGCNQAEALLTKGRTGKISGFKKKEGGTYSAYLVLQDGKIGFIYTR